MNSDAFWSKVQKGADDQCWPWTGALLRNGYGSVWIDGLWQTTHRAAFRLAKSDPGRLVVRHACDNRRCCNPHHLMLGTQKQNIADAMARGRMSKPPVHIGVTHPRAVLSEADVRAIRTESGNAPTIARKLELPEGAVAGVLSGRSWGWLT